MADITMCKDKTCELFHKCYRAQAKESMRQSFFCGLDKNGKDCEYFYPMDKDCEVIE